MKKFKYLGLHRMYQNLLRSYTHLKGLGTTFHDFCRARRVYENILAELTKVLFNGFIIWIVLIPFPIPNPVWFSPCYGFAYILLLELLKDVKQCLK